MKQLFHGLNKLWATVQIAPTCVEVRGPILALLPFVLVAPLFLAGPIRCTTQLSLLASLTMACALCAAAVGFLRPWRWRRVAGVRTIQLVLAEAATLLLSGFAVWALYNRNFGGFPNLDGWDGGTHVFIKDQFALAAPDIYNGQLAYYGFTWLLERILGVDSFRSFTIAFYVAVVATVVFPMLVTFSVTSATSGSKLLAFGVGTTVVVAASAGVWLVVILPLMHYNQAGGYYAHLFGLLPLLGLWAADSQIRHPFLRVGALLGGLALVRYTYSLNLADVTVAVAALLLVDGARRWHRLGQAVLALGLAVATYWIAAQIAPIFRIWGGMQGFPMTELLKADMILLAGLFLYLATQARGSSELSVLSSPLLRALRFPLFFAAANGAFFAHFRQGKGVQYYYPMKYQIWACILLALAVVVVLAHLAVALLQKGAWRTPRTWGAVLVIGAVLATVPPIWLKTFSEYRVTLRERMGSHAPPYKYLRPLADVEGIARIKAVLSSQHKVFGGYLTSFFPMFSFMNSTFGFHSGRQEFFPPVTQPGACVFWVSRARDTYRLGPAEKLDALRNTVAVAGSTCAEYSVPWKNTPQSLCYRCY
jgi:hypothetical protein